MIRTRSDGKSRQNNNQQNSSSRNCQENPEFAKDLQPIPSVNHVMVLKEQASFKYIFFDAILDHFILFYARVI